MKAIYVAKDGFHWGEKTFHYVDGYVTFCKRKAILPPTLTLSLKSKRATGGPGGLPPPQFDVLLVGVSFKALGYSVSDFQQAVAGVLQLLLHIEPLVGFVQLFQCLFHGPHPLLTLKQVKREET